MNTEVESRIRMLQRSLQCFVCGLLGLLPVIGVPFAFAALVLSGQVRAAQQERWNAARPYWLCGLVSAIAGILFWSAVLSLILYHRFRSGNQD